MSDTLLPCTPLVAPVPTLPGQTLSLDTVRLQPDTYREIYAQPIRWSDTHDGVLSHTGIAQFYEDTRATLMRNILGDEKIAAGKWKAVARAVTIEHLAPARYGRTLELAAAISTIGRSSYSFALAAFQGGQCVALGKAVTVSVGPDMRPTAIPEDVRGLLVANLWHHDGPDATGSDINTPPASSDSWPFSLDYPTRFSDTDAVGHINNVALVRYHDNGLMALCLALEGNVATRGEDGYWQITHREISMAGESFYPAPMRMCAGIVGEIGRTHFILRQALFQGERCTGQALTSVGILDAHGKPRDLSPTLRARLEQLRLKP